MLIMVNFVVNDNGCLCLLRLLTRAVSVSCLGLRLAVGEGFGQLWKE